MNRSRWKELRNNPTEAERLLGQHLRLRQFGGYKFRGSNRSGIILSILCAWKNAWLSRSMGDNTTSNIHTTNGVMRGSNSKDFVYSASGIMRFCKMLKV